MRQNIFFKYVVHVEPSRTNVLCIPRCRRVFARVVAMYWGGHCSAMASSNPCSDGHNVCRRRTRSRRECSSLRVAKKPMVALMFLLHNWSGHHALVIPHVVQTSRISGRSRAMFRQISPSTRLRNAQTYDRRSVLAMGPTLPRSTTQRGKRTQLEEPNDGGGTTMREMSEQMTQVIYSAVETGLAWC